MAQPKKYDMKLERTETAVVTVEATSEKQAAFNAALAKPEWQASGVRVTDVARREGGE